MGPPVRIVCCMSVCVCVSSSVVCVVCAFVICICMCSIRVSVRVTKHLLEHECGGSFR